MHFEVEKGWGKNAVVDFIAHEADLWLFLEKIPQTLVKVTMNSLDSF